MPAGKRGIGEELGRALVGHRGPLELDEEELGRDRGRALLHVLEQCATRGVGGVCGEPQEGVRADAVDAFVDVLELVDRRRQLVGGEHADAPVEPLGERLGVVERGREVAGERGVVRGGVQLAEVPVGGLRSGRHEPKVTAGDRRESRRWTKVEPMSTAQPMRIVGAEVVTRGLTHRYRTPDGTLTVLNGLDLSVEGGGYVALTGRSGAGKTTLLAVLGGLERPQQGRVVVGGHDLGALRGDELAAFRRTTVGFVFQHFGLLNALTAAENVELALTLAGAPSGPRRRRVTELLDAVGLAARARHRPLALSGGELQRVAIARALANEPRLVLADEPTGNLDDVSTERVLDLLEGVTAARGCTLIVVTHNHVVAARARHRLRLEGGTIRAEQPS